MSMEKKKYRDSVAEVWVTEKSPLDRLDRIRVNPEKGIRSTPEKGPLDRQYDKQLMINAKKDMHDKRNKENERGK